MIDHSSFVLAFFSTSGAKGYPCEGHLGDEPPLDPWV